MKSWEARGQIWSMEKDGTWQKKPKVYKAGEKYQKKSINGDPMDNRFHAVWAPEMHYIKSAENWFIVACMNESAGGRGSFILRSKTGKPEGPYENIEGIKTKPSSRTSTEVCLKIRTVRSILSGTTIISPV